MKPRSYGICPYRIIDDEVYVFLNRTSRVSDFNFFKGKIEQETIKECASREFQEEAGIHIPSELLHDRDYFFQKSKRKDIGIFLVDWKDLDRNFILQKKEIYQGIWVRLPDIVMSKNQQQILDDISARFGLKSEF